MSKLSAFINPARKLLTDIEMEFETKYPEPIDVRKCMDCVTAIEFATDQIKRLVMETNREQLGTAALIAAHIKEHGITIVPSNVRSVELGEKPKKMVKSIRSKPELFSLD